MDNKIVYDKFDWEQLKAENLQKKITIIKDFIPEDVKTIIDIGCGNGIITNALSDIYDITGVDRSETALKFLKTKKILANAENIPVEDNSFDMVFSSEMLEHLEDNTLSLSISEMKRLSKKYILISVPNAENPKKNSIECPKCKHIYPRSYHLQSFNLNKISKLFSEYEVVKSVTAGKKVRYYHPLILSIKHRFSPSKSWIPYYWISDKQRQSICPKCENEFTFPYKFHLIATTCDLVNITLSKKKPYWLIILLKKKY